MCGILGATERRGWGATGGQETTSQAARSCTEPAQTRLGYFGEQAEPTTAADSDPVSAPSETNGPGLSRTAFYSRFVRSTGEPECGGGGKLPGRSAFARVSV